MKLGLIAWSVLATFAAGSAHATTYFDTISAPATPTLTFDGPSDGNTILAQSFTAAIPDFTNVTLALAAINPQDNGSFTVFLVADDGSGGPGTAGSPSFNLAGTGFGNALKLGIVQDSSLSSTTLTNISFSVTQSSMASFTTLDNEYWVGIDATGTTSVEWGLATGGVGTAYQTAYNNTVGAVASTSGNYQLIVSSSPAPEPTSLTLLGIGLIGIGADRYRRRKRQG